MIKIVSIASGSKGNCYRVDDGETSLLIEAGIPLSQIKSMLNYKLSDIAGVLISHEHLDHSLSAEDLCKAGKNIYLSPGTAEALNFNSHRLQVVEAEKQFKVGSWIIKPLEAKHDAKEPISFLTYSKATGDRLAYITDTQYTKYLFNKLNYIMIECNYSKKILNENVKSGRIPAVQKKRLIQTHFGLENVKGFLRANNMKTVKEIWLLHLSERNSNADLFKSEIQSLTGKPVYIAG